VERSFDELPGWTFTVEEISAGVYRVGGRDLAGRSVSLTGEDPDKLLQDACARAAENADSPSIRPDQAK
jgi:hypothetical protein